MGFNGLQCLLWGTQSPMWEAVFGHDLGRAFSMKLRRQHPGINWAAGVCDDTVSLLV